MRQKTQSKTALTNRRYRLSQSYKRTIYEQEQVEEVQIQ